MITFKQSQALINDLIGSVVVLWGLSLLTIKTPDWVYVAVIFLGLSTVIGRKVVDSIPGLGGGSDTKPDKVQ